MFLKFLLLFTLFHVSHCQRRIIQGHEVSEDKTYVAYLVKAPFSKKTYDSWLCGGALVSKEFIITSAACVEDVDYLYAIAGYRKYIKDKFIEYDDCTKTMKKKVIYTCVPVAYEFSYDEIEKWSYIDIALVKVESPYNLFDARFQIMCSYIPTIARMNFDPKHQVPGTEAMVLGWGHTEMWREHGDKENYNQEILRYTATLLMDKTLCKEHYKDYPELLKTIDTYMLCSLDAGHMNDKGEVISENNTLVDGCIPETQKLRGEEGAVCPMKSNKEPIFVDYDNYPKDKTRKRMNTNDTIEDENIKNNDSNESLINENMEYRISRRNGICQNDHGGPLIAWIGKREVVIGVASVFKIDEENKCVGPYLYTSTVCNSAFLHCTLHEEPPRVPYPKKNTTENRRAFCDSPPSVRGYDTIERFVSWKDHPSGPADNEKALLRSKPVKKEDKFATRIESDKESNENNPLRDRNTQQVSFPKDLSGKYRAQARFLAQMKRRESSETKTEPSEEKEIEEPLNSSSEEIISSTGLLQTMNDPFDTHLTPNIESSPNLAPPPEARLSSNLGSIQQKRLEIGAVPQTRPYMGSVSNLQLQPEIKLQQPQMEFSPQIGLPLEMRQNPWQPPNLGYPVNSRVPSNMGPPPNRGPPLNLGRPQTLGPPPNLGSQQYLDQQSQGNSPNQIPLQNLEYLQNLRPPQNLGPLKHMEPQQILGNSHNLKIPQQLGPLENLRPPQNLGRPPNQGPPINQLSNQEFQQDSVFQQNIGPASNLGQSPNQGFQQNLGQPSNQEFQPNLGSQQNLRPPQNLMPLPKLVSPQNLGFPLNLRPTSNLGPLSNFNPLPNLAPSSYSENLKSFGILTNMGPSANMGFSPNQVPNMRSPTFEPPSRAGAPPKEGPNTKLSPNLEHTIYDKSLVNDPKVTQNTAKNQNQQNLNVFDNFKMRPQIPIRSK